MRHRALVTAAFLSCLAVVGYATWLRLEESRAWRAAWAEVTDPVEDAQPQA